MVQRKWLSALRDRPVKRALSGLTCACGGDAAASGVGLTGTTVNPKKSLPKGRFRGAGARRVPSSISLVTIVGLLLNRG